MTAHNARVDWVDAARGLCILFVVMMHSTLGVEKAVGETGWMGAVVAFAQPFRMPDFFLISGLFLSRIIDRDLATFLDRRVVHFAYFYLLWLTIQFAFKAPGMVAADGIAATLEVYLLAVFVDPFGTLWFIWILPVFALVVRWTRRLPPLLVLALAAGLEIAPVATGWTAVDEFAARFVYFYAGHLLASAILSFAGRVHGHKALALAALLAWGAVNGWAVASGIAGLPGVSLALGAAGGLAVVTVSVLIAAVPPVGDAARWIGSRSLIVYLSFFLPMAVTRTILVETGIVTDVGAMSLLVTVAAAGVPFAMAFVARRLGADFLYERPAFVRLPLEGFRRRRIAPAE